MLDMTQFDRTGLDRAGSGSGHRHALDHRVLNKTCQGVFLGLGFLRGAPLWAGSEGSKALINDWVVHFQPRQTQDDKVVKC